MRSKITALIVASALAGSLAGVAAIPAVARAATCTTTTTHTYTVSSRGSIADTWTLKYACGHDYQKWSHGWTHSDTGSSTTWHEYRDERRYPCYVQTRWTHSVSAKGTESNRVTVTSNC
jgi:hypothetical protein